MALIENLVVALGIQTSGFSSGLKKAQGDLSGFGKISSAVSVGLMGFAKGLMAPLIGLLTIKSVIDNLKESMDRLFSQAMSAAKLGSSMETFTGLAYAVQSVGIETEKFDTAIQKMLVTLSNAAEGGEKEIGVLKRLGISANSIVKASFGDKINMLITGFDKIKNSAERMDLARNIFGRGGAGMINLIREGRVGLDALINRAKFLGVVISDISMGKVLGLRKAWFDVGQSIKGVYNDLLIGLSGPLEVVFTLISNSIAETRVGIKAISGDLFGNFDLAISSFAIIYSGVMLLVDAFKVLMYTTASWASLLYASGAFFTGGDVDLWMEQADKNNRLMLEALSNVGGALLGDRYDEFKKKVKALKNKNLGGDEGLEGVFIGGGSERVRPGAYLRGSREAAEAAAKASGVDAAGARDVEKLKKLANIDASGARLEMSVGKIASVLGLDAGIV